MSEHEPEDSWPTPDAETIVVPRRDDTLVGGSPPPAAPPPPGPVGPPPDRRIGAGMLLGLVAVLLVAAGIAIAWYLTHRSSGNQTTTVVVTTAPKKNAAAPAKVAVPRVIGLKEPKAIARLASVGLRPKEVYKPTSKPKGVVVSQKPAEATSLAKGKQVTIVIDSGAPKVKVPDLTGKSASAARAALDQLGLDSTITKVTSDQPAGTVVDQAPNGGGKLAKGSSVTLSVAKAKPKPTTTPATTTTAAQQTTTAPAAPTTTAAAPPQPTNATMPNVVQQDEASAVQAMGQAGILPSIVFIPGDDPLGTIEEQAKPAGSSVPFHGHVQINASSGPGKKPQQQVPNVIGKSLNDAVAAMQGAHLRLIYLKFPVSSKAKAGEIVQQSPLGGNTAPQNAQVLVFLAAYQQ